jgi:signal peptidase I
LSHVFFIFIYAIILHLMTTNIVVSKSMTNLFHVKSWFLLNNFCVYDPMQFDYTESQSTTSTFRSGI